MVNEERIKKSFTELIRIYAPSKGEREVCDYLKQQLRTLGASRIIEDNNGSVAGGNSGNLIAVFNENMPGLPSIAFTAHMDCVENCKNIEPVLQDGIFSSKGDTILGGDDKAGVAAILEGLHLMKENYIPHGKITVIFTVQEENGLIGSRHIEEQYLQGIDFGYTLDVDGKAGTLINEGPSEYTVDFLCKGVAAHAGMCPEKGTNAIAMAALGIASCPTGRIDEETTCNIGTISGGMATNIVPEHCAVHCEARSRNNEKLEKLVSRMEDAFRSAAEKFPQGQLTIKKEKTYDAFKVEETSPAVALFRSACAEAKFPVSISSTGGGSDANWFGTKGFPAVLLGVGMTNFHTNQEILAAQDLFDAGELVYRIIEAESHFSLHG